MAAKKSNAVDQSDGLTEEAEAMAGQSGMWNVLRSHSHNPAYLEARPRSIGEVATGRQTFTVVVPTHKK